MNARSKSWLHLQVRYDMNQMLCLEANKCLHSLPSIVYCFHSSYSYFLSYVKVPILGHLHAKPFQSERKAQMVQFQIKIKMINFLDDFVFQICISFCVKLWIDNYSSKFPYQLIASESPTNLMNDVLYALPK